MIRVLRIIKGKRIFKSQVSNCFIAIGEPCTAAMSGNWRHSICHYSPTNSSTTLTVSMVFRTDKPSCDRHYITKIHTVWKWIWTFRATSAMTKRELVFCNYETLVSGCWLTGWPDARTMVLGDAKRTKPRTHTRTHTKLLTCTGQNASSAICPKR